MYTTVKEWTTAIADAIRQQEGSSDQIWHQDFPARILEIGGTSWLDVFTGNYDKDVVISGEYSGTVFVPENIFENTLRDKNITSLTCRVTDSDIGRIVADTRIGKKAFVSNNTLVDVDAPSISDIGEAGFQSCDLSGTLDFTGVVNIGKEAFMMTNATLFDFPSCQNVGMYAFDTCNYLTQIDFGEKLLSIATGAFYYSPALESVVIRRTSGVPTLSSSSAFTGTSIASGAGYIYVPSALLSQYQAATNWSSYAAQFRALENYTIDGTINGDLDPTKI